MAVSSAQRDGSGPAPDGAPGSDPDGVIPPAGAPLRPGTRVDVRNRFDGSWSRGFEVAESDESGYVLRRLSDATTLPDRFARHDVRRQRRRQGFWWY